MYSTTVLVPQVHSYNITCTVILMWWHVSDVIYNITGCVWVCVLTSAGMMCSHDMIHCYQELLPDGLMCSHDMIHCYQELLPATAHIVMCHNSLYQSSHQLVACHLY